MERQGDPDAFVSDRSGLQSTGPTHALVGRTRERELLRDAFAMARSGHGRLCLIGGEAGLGKTSLARDLAATAGALGARVLSGSCYESQHPPYVPAGLFESCHTTPRCLRPRPRSPAAAVFRADQAVLFAVVRRFIGD